MFNSLLFQLLQESPDIIPQIAPAIWESACLFKTNFRGSWTESVLGELLYSAVKELSMRKVNTCLFIDGLDEFAGNKSGLISTIRKVSEIANIKLRVSSRPWVEFEDSFGRGPSLRVQDLTYPDIKLRCIPFRTKRGVQKVERAGGRIFQQAYTPNHRQILGCILVGSARC